MSFSDRLYDLIKSGASDDKVKAWMHQQDSPQAKITSHPSFEAGMILRDKKISPRGAQREFGFVHAPVPPPWAENAVVEAFESNHANFENFGHIANEYESVARAGAKMFEKPKGHGGLRKTIISAGLAVGIFALGRMLGGSDKDESYQPMFGNSFSGRDDAYNTIEGLKHGGQAQRKRRQMTPFGSGWDPLRNMVADQLGKGEHIFEKFVKSPEFQTALDKGAVVKTLGKGGFGQADLMSTSIKIGEKTHTFEYARKLHFNVEGTDAARDAVLHESAAAEKLGDLNAPNIYRTRVQSQSISFTDMEVFKGKDVRQHMLAGGQLSKEQVGDIRNFFEKSHARGVAHTDASRDVALFNRQSLAKGEYSGEMVPHNMMITENGRMGVYDFGLATNPKAPADTHFTQAFMGKNYKTAGDVDMDLVRSLEEHDGKVSNKYSRNRPSKTAPTKLDRVKADTSLDVFGPAHVSTSVDVASTVKDSRRKLAMASTQRDAVEKSFSNAIFGGKRSKSSFVSTRR